jgi:ABC-type polysaccharide/polyol phosphate export permease
MGTQMLVIMAVCTFGGYEIDKWLAWKFPLFTLLLSLFGIAAALYLSIKDFLRMNTKKKE